MNDFFETVLFLYKNSLKLQKKIEMCSFLIVHNEFCSINTSRIAPSLNLPCLNCMGIKISQMVFRWNFVAV